MTQLKNMLTHQNTHTLPSSEYVWQGLAAGANFLSKVGLREIACSRCCSYSRYLLPGHPISHSVFAPRAERVFTDFSPRLPHAFAVPHTKISCKSPLPLPSASHAGTAKDHEPHQQAPERGFAPAHPQRYPENHSGVSRADKPQLYHAQQQ